VNIASWNINSVRIRTDQVLDYLKKKKIDILVLQEIKTEEKNFPFQEFNNAGYNSYVNGQKSYNGVAILSKEKLITNHDDFKDPLGQSRFISANINYKNKKIFLVSIYLPNGNPVNTEKIRIQKKMDGTI